ncbi:MAG: replication-relaxation family protein [Alphaproteobacteria bacterium]|nr:replication-relaxation family protein [Alphaproteobacteria bacterium]
MQTDSLLRRLRSASPQPVGQRLSLGPADLRMFGAINRHGPLPSTYLHRFSGHKDRSAFANRLTKLYNGTAFCAPLLSRPPQQFQSFAARYQHLIYDLTPMSRALLRDQGVQPVDRTDPFLHRFMGACVGASIEFATGELGHRYIARTEVLAKHGATLATRVGVKTLIPDDLFGLQYAKQGYRFFAVEVDRNTESIERKPGGYNTFARKLDGYLALMMGQGFKECWGIPNLLVLTVTTNKTHLAHLIEHVRGNAGRYADHFLFKANPDFGVNWRIPEIMTDLLREPWARGTGSFDIAQP